MARADAAHSGLDPVVASIVHEEVDRLPEGLRLPVVLCDLEGLTYEQAAGRLRWTEPTLRHRLVKARRRLRDRLTRRGVTGAALGVVVAASEATAAVPASWAESAVAAATGGAGSAAAIALTRIVLRNMFVAKLKIAAAVAIVAVGMASSWVFEFGSGRSGAPGPALNPQAAALNPPAARDAPQPAPAPGASIEVRGRVVGPDGKPVPGATVRTAYLYPDGGPTSTSGPDGRFLMRIPPAVRSSDIMLNGYNPFVWVVAMAPGFGPGWVRGAFKAGASSELTVRLVEDGPPIEGRIVDLEGRPVAGAEVNAGRLYFSASGDLTAWLARMKNSGGRGPFEDLEPLTLKVATTKTGPDGRFRLAGIGRQRVAELSISGPAIATTEVYAMNCDGAEIRTLGRAAGMTAETRVIHARRFEYAVAPMKLVEGIVRDKDTGQPIAGMTLHAAVYRATSIGPVQGIEATTDAQGRYRLIGLPKAPVYQLAVEQAEGKPYARVSFRVRAGSPAFEPVPFDIALKRGIFIRGRVTDKATGRPAPGHVHAYTFRDNPAVKEFPGYNAYNNLAYIFIKDDGRYEVVGLPGRNIVACRSEMRRYRGTVGASKIPGYDPQRMALDTLPLNCYVNNYHVLAEVDVDPKAESATLDLQLDPGRSLTVNVVDPDGRPIGGTKVKGVTDLFSDGIEYDQESPTIEIHALDPSKPRRVIVTHTGRKLIGTAYLKGDEAGPMTIELQPWGTILGRIVDDEGQPRKGIQIMNIDGSFPKRPAEQGILPGDGRIDGDGRFRVERLVPGLEYGASASERPSLHGELFRDVAVAPGEVKDLGDLKIVPHKRRNLLLRGEPRTPPASAFPQGGFSIPRALRLYQRAFVSSCTQTIRESPVRASAPSAPGFDATVHGKLESVAV